MKVREKLRQISAFLHHTSTPLPLILDSLRLQRRSYIAVRNDGLKLRLRPRCGEWFTFYENLIREDYLKHRIRVKEGDVIVDVGANIGAFSILAAKRVGNSGRVLALEPDPSICDRLRENIELNGLTNVVVYDEAVGESDGQVDLHINRKSAFSTILDQVDGDDRSAKRVETIHVAMCSLTSVVRRAGGRVQLLKLDCEGSEYAILEALTPDEAAFIDQVTMEVHQVPDHSTAWIPSRLQDLGFDVSRTDPLTAVRVIA